MARRNKSQERDVATDRVRKLFAMAEQAQAETPHLAHRYVRLARRIAMRYQVSLPRELRRRICRTCDSVLVPGRTSRVRVIVRRVTVTCLLCDTVKRYPLEGGRSVRR